MYIEENNVILIEIEAGLIHDQLLM